jgi:hypothetical protein
MMVARRLFGDGAGHAGLSRLQAVRTALSRNGVVVAESDEARGNFAVPAAPTLPAGGVGDPAGIVHALHEGDQRMDVRLRPRRRAGLVAAAPALRLVDPTHGAYGNAPASRTFELPLRVAAQDGAGQEVDQIARYSGYRRRPRPGSPPDTVRTLVEGPSSGSRRRFSEVAGADRSGGSSGGSPPSASITGFPDAAQDRVVPGTECE